MKRLSKLSCSVVLASTLLLAGCATGNVTSTQNYNVDPYYKFNHAMFTFNNDLTKGILRPWVKFYDFVTPQVGRMGVRNFFRNIGTVPDIINDGLQANWHYAGHDIVRFLLNSTLGFFGLIDVATHCGFPAHQQSFGLTMAKWGYTDANYLVLPFLGPTTTRGAIGMVPDTFISPLYYWNPHPHYWKYVAYGVKYTQLASDTLPKQRILMQISVDPYVGLRNAYLQNRGLLVQQIDTDGGPVHHHLKRGAPAELGPEQIGTGSQSTPLGPPLTKKQVYEAAKPGGPSVPTKSVGSPKSADHPQ